MFYRGSDQLGFWGVPLGNGGSVISAAYPIVLADQGLCLMHALSDNSARTFTIPAQASIAFPLYTTLLFVNLKNTLSIAINTDTLILANSATTGTRTLAVNGVATAYMVNITMGVATWLIWGVGLT